MNKGSNENGLEDTSQPFLRHHLAVLFEIRQIPLGNLPVDEFLIKNYALFKSHKALNSLIDNERYQIWQAWTVVSANRTTAYKTEISENARRRRNLVKKFDLLISELRENESLKGIESPDWGDLFVGDEDVGIELAMKAADLQRQLVKARNAVNRTPQVGRPLEATQEMARRLAVRWHAITGDYPSVTREIDGPRVGLFVDFLQAAFDTLRQPDLDGNVGAAAERAAAWFRRSGRV